MRNLELMKYLLPVVFLIMTGCHTVHREASAELEFPIYGKRSHRNMLITIEGGADGGKFGKHWINKNSRVIDIFPLIAAPAYLEGDLRFVYRIVINRFGGTDRESEYLFELYGDSLKKMNNFRLKHGDVIHMEHSS